ncbi:hypothetical protein ACVV2G_25070 [Streptomyces ziwulingensis]
MPAPPAGAGEPVAEAGPADVARAGTVTVSVSCAPTGGSVPAPPDAVSPAIDEGTTALREVVADDGSASGPAYRGTVRTAAAEDAEEPTDAEDLMDAGPTDGVGGEDAWTVDGACPEDSGGEGGSWSTTTTVPEPEEGSAAGAPPCPEPAPHGEAPVPGGAPVPDGAPAHREAPAPGEAPARGASCATEPACPEPVAPPGGTSAKKPCGGAAVEHGVRAGAGGAFTDSTPALVAGGLLLAGAGAAAAHRLRLRPRGDTGHR